MAIDSSNLRRHIAGEQSENLKIIIDLMNFFRAPVTEQCLWTLNNFMLGEREYASVLV